MGLSVGMSTRSSAFCSWLSLAWDILGQAGARPYRLADEQELIPTEKPSARKQTEVTVPMPEHESYPYDH